MTLQVGEDKFNFKMLEDKKTVSMVIGNAKEDEIREIILKKQEG